MSYVSIYKNPNTLNRNNSFAEESGKPDRTGSVTKTGMIVLSTHYVRSDSSPTIYKIESYSDGSHWCDCPSMKFDACMPKGMKRHPQLRTCKHTKALGLLPPVALG